MLFGVRLTGVRGVLGGVVGVGGGRVGVVGGFLVVAGLVVGGGFGVVFGGFLRPGMWRGCFGRTSGGTCGKVRRVS